MNNHLRRFTCFVLLFVVLFSSVLPAGAAELQEEEINAVTEEDSEAEDIAEAAEAEPIEGEHVSGEVLVVYEDDIPVQQEEAVKEEYGLDEDTGADSLEAGTGNEEGFDTVHQMEIVDGTPLEEVIAQLEEDPRVKYAEPNYLMKVMEGESWSVNDPYTSNQWYLDMINAYDAWENLGTGDGDVKVVVLDTQVQLEHPDLAANLVDANNVLTGGAAQAAENHGTHVAGIIAATADNETGIAGVSYNKAKVIPVTAGSGNYLKVSDIILGYQYAVSKGARVANMSFGSESRSSTLESTLKQGRLQGVVNIAAAGNDDVTWSNYPSDLDCVIGVISTADGDSRSSFSNYGEGKNISAPGSSIYSTLPTSRYGSMNGTSMATPVVAGVVALMLNANPDLTVSEVEDILYATAKDLGEPGWDEIYGYGRVDARAAVQYALGGETAVSSIALSESTYTLEIGDTFKMLPEITPKNATNRNQINWISENEKIARVDASGTVTGISPGTAVIRVEIGGITARCEVVVGSVVAIPNTYAKSYNYNTIRVTWSSVAGADGYEVWRSNYWNRDFESIAEVDGTSYLDTPVETGNYYYYRAQAYIETGEGRIYGEIIADDSNWAWATAQLAAPSNVRTVALGSDIRIRWDAVTGATGYVIERAVDGSNFIQLKKINDASVQTYLDTNLSQDCKYSYRIYALNSGTCNDKITSDVVWCTLEDKVGVPASVQCTVLDQQSLRITWESALEATGYEIHRKTGSGGTYQVIAVIDDKDAVSFDDSGLTAGTAYYYMVRPYNPYIYGTYSAVVSGTPSRQTAPGNVKAEPVSETSIKVSWEAVDGAESYIVTRYEPLSSSRSEATQVQVSSVLEYLHTDLNSQKTYSYTVSTSDGIESAKVSAKPQAVYEPLEGITLSSENLSLNAGSYAQPEIIYNPSNVMKEAVVWTSGDKKVAVVDEAGYVTGIAAGSTTITCETAGFTAKCAVTVEQPQVKAPSNVAAVSTGFNQLVVSWDAVEGADGYKLYYKTGTSASTAFKELSTISGNVIRRTCTGYYNSTYTFKMRAYKTVDGETVLSDDSREAVCAITGGVPQNVSASSDAGEIRVSWNKVPGAYGYTILRSTNSTYGFKSQATVIGENTLSYIDEDEALVEGTLYYYKVKAYIQGNVLNSKYGDDSKIYGEASKTAAGKIVTAPNAPESVIVQELDYDSIKIEWNKVEGINGYELLRSTSENEDFESIYSVSDADVLSYTDDGVKTGTTYYYAVKSYFETDGHKVYSRMSRKTSTQTTLPVPGKISASLAGSEGIKLTWDAADGAEGYEVERSENSKTGFKHLRNITGQSYTDGTVPEVNKNYYYRVRAYRVVDGINVYSSYSNEAVKKLTVTIPKSPKVSSASYNSIKVSWAKSADAEGYEVRRSTSSGGTYSSVKKITGNSTVSFTNTGLTTNKKYYYKIRAYITVNGVKKYTKDTAVVSAAPVPAKPGSPKAASAGYNSIKLSWSEVTGASGYRIYRSTSSSGTYTYVKTVTGGSSTSYTNSGLTLNKTYYYKIRAFRAVNGSNVFGSYTSIINARTKVAKPSSFKAVAGSRQVKLSFKKVSGASGYEVYRTTKSTGTYSRIKIIAKGSTVSCTNSGLSKGKTYYYKIRAYRTVSGKRIYGSYTSEVKAKVK